jgi:hypothetical protein
MNSEAETEAAIVAAGKTAPRLTPDLIDATIVGDAYVQPSNTSLTICVLFLRNGFTVVGESASASLENFDPEIGRKIAKDKAREKIWQLEGYLLRQRLFETPPSFQGRVLKEKEELDEKIAKLTAFTGGGTFATLPDDEQRRMFRQLGAMSEYSAALGERIAAFDAEADRG